jgi:methionyl-tRNA formyltransferase
MKNVVFLGSDGIGLPSLQWLYENGNGCFRLVGVVSGLDRRKGRGLKLIPNPIVTWAREKNLPLLQASSPKDEILPWMQALKSDLGIVFAYGHILSQVLLDAIPFGFLNLHASLLPDLRGPSPIEGAILLCKKQTGMSLMQLVKKMDAGPIYGYEKLDLGKRETAQTLREKMAMLAIPLLNRYIFAILEKKLMPQEQDHSRATYVSMIKKSDGLLDFCKPAEHLEAQIRAYITWPGSFFYCEDQCVRVGSAEYRFWKSEEFVATPGTILGLKQNALEIAVADGVLRCLELQLPTKKMLPARLVCESLLRVV